MQFSAMAGSGTGRFFTRKSLWQLIWPLVIEQFLTITLGIADIIMIASRGESAVSGVSLVDTIFILINSLFAALATGGAVVCSQYIGNRNPEMASRTAKQLIYTVIIGALAVMLVGFAGGEFLLGLIFGRISSDVMTNARTYFWYMLLSLPSVALYNGCAALFRSQGNSRVSMFTALFSNALHIGVNATLLFGFGFGVEGVAFSTFISRTVAAAILLILLHNRKTARNVGVNPAVRMIDISGISKIRIEPSIIKKILRIGIPNGLENSVFQIGKILVLTLIATFGTGAIAANAAANTISSFEVLPASSIGLALLTVVGQCIGAGRVDEAVYYTKRLMLLAYIAMAALNVPLLLCSKWIISLYGLSPSTADLGWQMLMWHGVCGIVFWPSSFTLPNALRAAGDAKFTMVVSLVSMWIVRVGLSYVFAIGFGLGAVGVWIAMCCDWVVRDALFIWRFARGKWKNRRLI